MSDPKSSQTKLSLTQFFPYKLSQFQHAISRYIAGVYTGTFNLSRQQWRVLAVLGDKDKTSDNNELSAKLLGEFTDLDKMQTSRAIEKLEQQQLINKREDPQDNRSKLIALNAKGQQLYDEIVPLVLEKEQQLLTALTDKQQLQLQKLMDKLLKSIA